MTGINFELNQNYKKAWEELNQNVVLVSWVNYSVEIANCLIKDIASTKIVNNILIISARGTHYAYVPNPTFIDFEKICKNLDIEFYLPLPNNTIVISPEDLEAIASKVIEEKVGKPLDNLIALTKGAL